MVSTRLQIDLHDAEYRALLKIAMAKKVQAHVLIEGLVRRALSTPARPLTPPPPTNIDRHVWDRTTHDPEMIHLHRSGWNDSQIARHFGFCQATVREHRLRLGLPKNTPVGRKPKGGDDDEAVPALRAARPDPADQLDRHALG